MVDKWVSVRDISVAGSDPFSVYANLFVDESEKDSLPPFLELLFKKGAEHEDAIASNLDVDMDLRQYSRRHARREALKGMKNGVYVLREVPLVDESRRVRGRADFVVRVQGNSVFGSYAYRVVEVKTGSSLKQKYCLQATQYQVMLNEKVGQEVNPAIILGDGEEHIVDTGDYREELAENLDLVNRIRRREVKPRPVYGSTKWPWSSYADRVAKKNKDISLVYNLQRRIYKGLRRIGVETLRDFENASKEDVLSVDGIGEKTYERIEKQVKALRTGEPIIRREYTVPENAVYFDIEGDTFTKKDYLYGVLDDTGFHAFWGDESEKKMWDEFTEYVSTLPEDTNIVYYTDYERRSVTQYLKRFGAPNSVEKILRDNMVDAFKILKRSVTLPTTDYSLKTVADSIGFSWRADDAGGANSIQWYKEYKNGDAEMKKKIERYNEDDVRATREVLVYLRSLQ